MYLLKGYMGRDFYDHGKNLRKALDDVCTEHNYTELFKLYCEDFSRQIERKECAWVSLYVLKVTAEEGVSIIKQWTTANKLQHRTQINKEAQQTNPVSWTSLLGTLAPPPVFFEGPEVESENAE